MKPATPTRKDNVVDTSVLLDVIDHDMVFRWLSETLSSDPEAFVLLSKGNVNNFLNIFGPSIKKATKTPEQEWNVAHNGLSWLVRSSELSSRYFIRTSHDYSGYSKDADVGLSGISFLKRLLFQIESLNGEKNGHP